MNNTKIDEKYLQRQIIDGLEYNGWKVWRVNNMGTFNQKTGGYYFHGKAGVSDLIAIKDKTLLFIEVKSPKGKLTEAQKEFLGLVNSVSVVKGIKACNFADIMINLNKKL